MEKQVGENKEVMQEERTTSSAIAQEIQTLVEDEFVCKEFLAEENSFTISLWNGQKFRVCISEI